MPGALRQFGDWHDNDVNLVCMPLFHIGGSGWALVGFYRGIETVLMRDPDPAAILRLIPEYRITKAFMVPALLLFLLQTPQCRTTDFSSLELIVYGASPAPVDLVRNALKVFGCGLAQVYGLTETTGAITYLPPEDHDEHAGARLKSCGKAMTGIEIRVVDASGKDVATGEVGEIITRSPQNMLGYWNQPEATRRAMRGDWFHTGDAGYLDQDGYLYIYDRVKDMIISGGENIYPAEVESALFGHPAVADVAVIGVPDDKWGEAVKAFVVRKPGAEVTPDELIGFARERIAAYKVPRSIDFVELRCRARRPARSSNASCASHSGSARSGRFTSGRDPATTTSGMVTPDKPHEAAGLRGTCDRAAGLARVAGQHLHQRSVRADLAAVGQIERVFETCP